MLTFLIPLFGTLTSLAGQLVGKQGGGETVAHYTTLVLGLVRQGLQAGIDIKAEANMLLIEMQTLVAENRAATPEEMAASNARLKEAVAAALAHDTSTHPSIKPANS
jgi:hypothetical protein